MMMVKMMMLMMIGLQNGTAYDDSDVRIGVIDDDGFMMMMMMMMKMMTMMLRGS